MRGIVRDPCPAHQAEAALVIRAALAPHFMTLRRLIAQIAGLMLLTGSRRSETQDGIAVSLAALRLECAEAIEGIAAARARLGSESLSQHRLAESSALVMQALRLMTETILPSRPGGTAETEAKDAVIGLLGRARWLMSSVANEGAGLVMVGFSHACCCHGAPATESL